MQKPPVFIECGSANSFELSPRFANLSIRGSRVRTQDCIYIVLKYHHIHRYDISFCFQETVSLDVESELREAMSDTVQKTADGEYPSFFLPFFAFVVNAIRFVIPLIE